MLTMGRKYLCIESIGVSRQSIVALIVYAQDLVAYRAFSCV